MYFNANLEVRIAGNLVQTVVSVKTNNDSQHIGAYCDLVVPLNCRIEYNNPNNEKVYLTDIPTNLFKSGDSVEIIAWYDGYDKITVFKGFVYDFIEGMPLTIKCLDYIYFFNLGIFGNQRITTTNPSGKKITGFGTGVHYKTITLKNLAQNIIDFVNQSMQIANNLATPVNLILPTIDLTLVNLTFIEMSPAAILEWIKKEIGLNISLFDNQLYINVASNTTNLVKYNTGRNVIKSGMQKADASFQKIKVKAWFINEDGTKSSIEVGDTINGICRDVFFYRIPKDLTLYNKLANEALLKYSQHKYNGSIETLLYPEVNLFDKCEYTDIRYPNRDGNYVCIGQNFDIGPQGFHRKLKLAFLTELNTVQ